MKTGRRRGRPRKPADTIGLPQFGRAARVLSIYDPFRSCGGKYSSAIQEREQIAELRRKGHWTRTHVKPERLDLDRIFVDVVDFVAGRNIDLY
jgi:hypothetical protein